MMNAVGFSVMRELKNIGNLQRVKVNSNSNLLLEGGKFWDYPSDCVNRKLRGFSRSFFIYILTL